MAGRAAKPAKSAKTAKTAKPSPQERLEPYRKMRDFDRTPEPSGSERAAESKGGLRFVVQRHRARRLHYDLRFEMSGTLASWAVPKGPTLDPKVRRMAVHVEDHPIEYLHFEGVIPSGEYGGGDVIVWDTGTWEIHAADDPVAAVAAGELHADVYGEKLRGRFVLVRTTRGKSDGQDEWVLLHKRDDYAVAGWDPEEHPKSVLSGRTNDEVKADPDLMWRSDLPAAKAAIRLRPEPPSDDELAALDELGQSGTWHIFGRELKLTNLGKEMFPARQQPSKGGRRKATDPPLTKRDLIRYAACIAPTAVPYLRGRALNMHRFPDGASRKGFWHKQTPTHAPDWITRWQNPDADAGETSLYTVVDEPAALVWAANFGALEWHAWTSLTEKPHEPTYALLDIDPGEDTSWDETLLLARLHRDALAHLDVRSYPKLTGRRGIQVWIPIAPGYTYKETRAWAQKVSKAIGNVVPKLVSWRWTVDDRGGLARLDYTQNVINKTLVAPYSPRPSPGAPVSTPITWEELDSPDLRSDMYTISTVLDRVREVGDPFIGVLDRNQILPRIT
jgi:bifunctional non-homologous end joining protein LigD